MSCPILVFVMLLPSVSLAYRMHADEPFAADALEASSGAVAADALVASNAPLLGGSPDVSSFHGSQPIEPAAFTEAKQDAHASNASQSGETVESGLLDIFGKVVKGKAVPTPLVGANASFQAEAADWQGNFNVHFPPWAVNMYNFMFRWSPLACVMCACAFLCFLATGRKPDHLDYLGVLAHMFMFELMVLILAGAAHTFRADGNEDKTPHLVAKVIGVAIFGCGTVVNIWWLAWQTLRYQASKSPPSAERPPLAAEGVVQNSSAGSSRTR